MTDHAFLWQQAHVAEFADCRATVPSAHPTIGDVLDRIRNPESGHAALIERARQAATKDECDRLKEQLPAVSFAADLHHRRGGTPLEDRIADWSGVAALDIDGVADPASTRDALRGDPFVAAAFVSPSGSGVKVLVRVADPNRFADCWRAASLYFSTCHGLAIDPAPKHPVSLCYLSTDPDLHVAEEVEAFQPMAADPPKIVDQATNEPAMMRPGDDFNRSADIGALLTHHGWSLGRDGENQHWRRPGKSAGCSATLKDRIFYVFSSNAPPFEPNRGYCPFTVYALLEHNGDFTEAAKRLRELGFGEDEPNDVDLSGLMPKNHQALAFDLQTFAETPERSISWLWPGVIPRGMLSLIGGKQGLGKSFLICDLAARVSAGRAMPDGSNCPPGKVLLLAREDDASCVLLPRLRASAADLSRVSWSVFSNSTTGSPIDLASHIDMLADATATHGFDLIVVDTFAAFAPAGTDANAAQDVRLLLDALTRLARNSQAAVVVVAHLRKSGQGDGDPMDAIAGSAQMTAGVRVAALLDKGARDGERWFRVVKSNLGKIDENGWTWRFHWPDPFTEGASDMPRVEWAVAGEEYASLEANRQSGRQVIESDAVRDALIAVLKNGPRSLTSACELVVAVLRKTNPRVRKSEIELVITEVIQDGDGIVDAWEGPRGAKLVGLPGSRGESPEAKAYRLAKEDPTQSVRALKALAGCRTETASDALKQAKEAP